MKPKFRSLIAAFAPLSRSSLIVVASLCAASSAYADQTWTGDALDGFWTSTGNWSGAAIPGAADIAIFNASSDTNTATTLAATFSIKGLRILNPVGAVSIAAGNTLTLDSSGIDMSTAEQDLSIAAPLVVNTAQTWNVASSRLLTVSGSSSGSTGALTKSGDGILQLNASQLSASGSVLLSGGTTRANAGNFVDVFNSAPITFQNGASLVHWNGSSTVTLLSSVVVASGQSGTINMGGRMGWGNNTAPTETLTGAGTLNLIAATTASRDDIYADMTAFTGSVNFSGSGNVRLFINGGAVGGGFTNSTVDLAGTVNLAPQTNSNNVGTGIGNVFNIGKLTGVSATASLGGGSAGIVRYSVGSLGTDTSYAGGIRGNAQFYKEGSDTLTLTNTTLLDHTGATAVNGGTLKYNGTKTGTGTTTVNSGGTLAGTGILAGTTIVATDGILAPGDTGVGNLTFANLTLNSGGIVQLGTAPSNNKAVVQAGGTLTLNGGINVDVNGFDTDGIYTIMDVTGATVSGSASTSFTAINGNGSKVYTFSNDGLGSIKMTISVSDPSNFWNIDSASTSTWGTNGNWSKGTFPNAIGALAKFGPGVGGTGVGFNNNQTVTLDSTRIVGELTLNDDFGWVMTLDPGVSGILSLDNGAAPAGIVSMFGDHVINAPVAVDAQGVAIDVAGTGTLSINGIVSGLGAQVGKSGTGTVALFGDNTYGGGTLLSAGNVRINSLTSLGATGGAVTFAGGVLQLGVPLSGVTRSFQVSGASSAIVDTNGFAYGYAGVISPLGGGTGGLTKNGGGTMTLSAAQTYTGTTALSGGGLEIAAGASISGGATNVTGGTLSVTGGSLTASATSSVTSSAMALSSGSIAFNAGFNVNTSNPSSNAFIHLTGGTFSSSFVSMGRCTSNTQLILSPGAAGRTDAGLYINGADATIAGNLTLGTSINTNSTVSARIDSGSLAVGGATFIQVNSPDRWSALDVNGGTFTSTNVVTGIQIGSGFWGNCAFLVRNGNATVERVLLFQDAGSTLTSRLNVSGGTLYVGAGGIVGNNNGGAGVLDVQLGTATLGAKAGWSTLLGATLNTTIKAADVADVAHDISIAGVVGGAGGLEKTGGGALTLSGTNSYLGTTTVTAGSLNITGDSSAATGAVVVASAATLGGNGNIGGNVTIQSGGHHALAVAATPGAQVTRTITGILDLQGSNILDLTSAGPVASGVYILATASGGITGNFGSFTLNGGLTGTPSKSGSNLILTVGSSAYGTWAGSFGLQDPWLGVNPALNGTPGADPDNDGIANELEFVLSGNPTLSSSNILPTLVVNSTSFIFTFSRADVSKAEVALAFQYGTTLNAGSWTSLAIGEDTGSSDSGVVITGGDPTDSIVVTIPKGANTKLFGRLRAVK